MRPRVMGDGSRTSLRRAQSAARDVEVLVRDDVVDGQVSAQRAQKAQTAQKALRFSACSAPSALDSPPSIKNGGTSGQAIADRSPHDTIRSVESEEAVAGLRFATSG